MFSLLGELSVCLPEKGIDGQVKVFVRRVDFLCLLALCCVAGVLMLFYLLFVFPHAAVQAQ